jgi:predicted NBD/HSP70 family sugar kinase
LTFLKVDVTLFVKLRENNSKEEAHMTDHPVLNELPTDRRRRTRSSIYHYLYSSEKPCSKQQIANDLNLSLPTVYQNLSELLEAGLIDYVGAQRSSGGRPAMQLSVIPDARLSAGISITSRRLRFILTDLKCNQRGFKDVHHNHSLKEPGFDAFLAEELERFLDEQNVDRERLLGVGVTIAAMLSPDGQEILYAPTLKMYNVPLSKLLNKIPYKVYPENDGTSGGFGEWFSTPNDTSIAFLSLEDGVGGAVLVNNAPFTGCDNRSGEFGHMCVEPGGLKCACGSTGCLEAYCSAMRLSDNLGITLREFFAGVDSGNRRYRELLDDYLIHLAIGIHNIRMVLNCDVVIGGFMSTFLEPYIPSLRKFLARYDKFDGDSSYLRLSRHGKYASLMGSAFYFVKDFLDEI